MTSQSPNVAPGSQLDLGLTAYALKPEVKTMGDVFARERVRRAVGTQGVGTGRRFFFAQSAQTAQQPHQIAP